MKNRWFALIGIGVIIASGNIFAQENLLKNGGFEKITRKTKSSDNYLMKKIKAGWDFGTGPLARIPASWIPNLGAAKLEVVNAEKEKDNVHSGQYAMKLTTGEKSAHIYTSGAEAGKYEVSVWAKGKGKFSVIGYFHAKDPGSGKGKAVGSFFLLKGKAKENGWTEFKAQIDTEKIKAGASGFAFALVVPKESSIIFDDISLSGISAGN